MNDHSLDAALERHNIHEATCRYRRQGLACSRCSELRELLTKALSAAIAQRRAAA